LPRLHRSRLATALVASLAVILSSPFVGDIRSALITAFPAQFRLIIGSAIAAVVVVALLVAVVKIRDRRRWRFTGLAVAVGGATVYARIVATGNLQVDVVEHVHFIEYGIVAWLFYRAWRPMDNGTAIIWPLLAGTLVGIIDESVQWFIPARVGEAHDIFLDAVAVGCGLCFAASIDPPPRLSITLERSVARPIAYGVSAVLLAFAVFFQAVHLGHQLYEPGIGMFWSRYNATQLDLASSDRAIRWSTAPPTRLRRLSREDQYLSEALWHVQERNRAWGAGDPFTAWRENLILERFFAPVLDTPTYASRVPPRWAQQQRDDTAARVGSDPGIYISRAAPYPIYAWSPVVFWSAVAVVIAGVISAC
jgi:VanZ family protein